MRIRLIGLAILTLLIIIFTFTRLPGKKANPQLNLLLPSPFPTPTAPVQVAKAVIGSSRLAAAWVRLDSPSSINLIANFEAKKTAEKTLAQNGCRAITNAGFYTPQMTPVGLFSQPGNRLGDFKANRLLNGVFAVTDSGNPLIGPEEFDTPERFQFQTGPVLLTDGVPATLTITNDEKARRIIAAVDEKDRLVLIAVYDPDAVFDGPLLSQLPQLISDLSLAEKLQLSRAVNLDGGSASVFLAPGIKLNELTLVGSFLCVR